VITAHEAIPRWLEGKGGLIAGITDGDTYCYRGQFYYDFVKTNVIRMAFALAYELARRRSRRGDHPRLPPLESMLDIMGVTEENWRDAARKRSWTGESRNADAGGTRRGRARRRTGKVMRRQAVFNSAELAREYGFTDVDRPRAAIWEYIARDAALPYKKCGQRLLTRIGRRFSDPNTSEKTLSTLVREVRHLLAMYSQIAGTRPSTS